jgi:organic radical activating enzyme
MASGEEAFMRASTNFTGRAEECRRLAKLAVKPEDFGHFLEMAETWELLAKQREADKQVADEQVADEQVADEQLAEEQVAAQQVADEQLADEQVADQEVADEELAAILALAGAIANGRNLRLGP